MKNFTTESLKSGYTDPSLGKGVFFILLLFWGWTWPSTVFAQTSIFHLMDTTGLTIHQIEDLADRYFEKKGTGRGTGYKQFQRWLYEKRFHVDAEGYILPKKTEDDAYKTFLKNHPSPVKRAVPWTEIGPDYWAPTSGWNPGNGRLTSIAVHASNASVIYVSSPGGGIWKTTNGGNTWTSLMDNENAAWMDVFHLAIDPGNASKIYAGLSEGGVIKSTSAGADWTETGSGPEGVRKIIVHPSNTNIVIVASSAGIHRSTNGGNTWAMVSPVPMEDVEFKPGDPNTVYASGNGATAFMRSTNNGSTWTTIGSANGITHTGRSMIAVSPQNPNTVYVVQASGDEFGRLYASTNSGLSFITTVTGNAINGTNYFGYESDGTGTGGQAEYDMAICVNPANASEVYIGGIICWKSTNGGFSFNPITEWFYPNTLGYIHADIHALEYIGTTLYSGSDGGIFKSTNGGLDWTDLSDGLGIRQIYRLSCSEQNAQVMCIGSQDNGTSIRKTNGAWVDWLGADGMDNVISPINTQVVFAMLQRGDIMKTTDGGETYIDLPQPAEGNWVTPLVMHPLDQDILFGGWDGVYKTTNGGDTWTYISSGAISADLDQLAIAPSNANFLYASVGSTLYRTSNGGSSWTSVNAGGVINDIYVSETNPQKIWVALNSTSNQVKVSENMGTTFTTISAGLPALNARCIVVDEDGANGIYLGMNIGVYFRNDNNPAWVEYESGLPLVATRDIELVKSAGLVRVATYGRGIWETAMNSSAPVTCPESCCIPFVYDYSICSDFESYSTGNIYPQGNPPFDLFSNSSSEQATVTTAQSVSGTKSLRFGSTSDITFDIFRTIDRVARLEWMMYIPSGKAGEFGFYTNNASIYPLYVNYNNGVANMYREITTTTSEFLGSFSYTPNTWLKSVLIFFPDDRIEFWQNYTLRHSIADYQSNQIGHLNFYYSNAGSTDFYIDDICYAEHFGGFILCPTIVDPVCVNGAEFSNACYAGDYGYSSCEYTEGPCGTEECNACDDCFLFLPRYLSSNTVDFQNQYCGDGGLSLQGRSLTTTYQWTVQNASVQYTNGTSSTSENPSMIFPGPGSYTVCQEVFVEGTTVFECCHTVIIGSCGTPPVAFYTSQLGLFNRFVLSADVSGGDLVQWTFSSPDVSFFQGDENSPNPVIEITSGTCVTVCLYVTNACGTSSYCTELCFNHPTCSGSTPPLYITNGIEPFIDDRTLEIDLPTPPGGGTATYQWDFGDGTFSTSQNITHIYDDYGHYTVCVVITVGCRTWCYCWCIRLNPCGGEHTFNDGLLSFEFTGSESDLTYTFTSSLPKAQGESWTINEVPVAGNSNSLTYTFPAAGNYVICFPYIGNDGCVHYTCIEVGVGNPFLCNTITWQYAAATGFRFSIPAGATEITWTIDETGQQIGQSATSNWVLPVNPCSWRTISVRYFDGTRYRVCCLRVYLCLPDECAGSIDYGYLSSSHEATFKLNSSGSTDITWFYDDTPAQTLGTGISISIPYPDNCFSRWISVRYKDSSGRWRICCRQVYFCNPLDCNLIRFHYTEGSGYSFSVEETQQNMSWVIEETGTNLGTNPQTGFVQFGPNCGYRTVSLRFWVPGLGWQLCCLRFYWCDPAACEDNITFSVADSKLVLQTADHYQHVSWFKGTALQGTQNPQTTNLASTGTHSICVRYFDPCDQSWYWCCRTYSPGGSVSALTFDLEDHVCGEELQVVDIPLRVKGFTNIQNFQFTVQIADQTKGQLVNILQKDIPGDFSSNVINTATGGVSWDNATAISLADYTEIATVRIRIMSNAAGETELRIVNAPVDIYVEDGSGNELVPVIDYGSFCYVKLVNVCGRVTREDLVPVSNVNVSLEGCQRYISITDANGQYCFNDVPAGATYQVRASKDTNYKNGVNSGDLSAIRRHILTSEPLNSPYKILAADGKLDSKVNSGDLSELRRLILGVIQDLPTCESWMFTDKSFVFANPADPFSSGWKEGAALVNVQDDVAGLDLIGWKMGDVNLSNNPQNAWEEDLDNRSATDIYLTASSAHVPGAEDFDIQVSTAAFDQVRAGQFSMQWDKDKFRLNGVSGYHPALNLASDNFFINQETGRMGFLWDDASPVSLPDGSVLFTLQFTSLVAHVAEAEIGFGEDPVNYYFENGNGEELNVITASGQVSVPVNEITAVPWVIYPNPTTGTIQLAGLQGQVSQLEISDVRGRVQYRKDDVDGLERLNLGHLQAGVYMLRATYEGRVYTDRIVVVR